jgi:SlyX protein
MDRRIQELEIRYMHQQRMLEELNQVVIEQGRAIDRLVGELSELRAMQPDDDAPPTDEPPPHY